MEPEVDDPDLVPWSDPEGTQGLCDSESLAKCFYEDDDNDDAEYPPESPPRSDLRSPEHLKSQDSESAGEQQSELSESEEDASYQKEEDVYITEHPHIRNSPKPLSALPDHPDSEPHAGQIPIPHSQSSSSSSSSSLGCAAPLTLALTLATEQSLGDSSGRQSQGTGNRRVGSSEEGGSSEAPPAPVFFGISDEGAEQADKWNSESDTDLCRPEGHGARCTRLDHNESQSERQVKENKSKCKRLAQLLTHAPNPQNKGALLFKKRRQRVEKYTLVSYGTGNNNFDPEYQTQGQTEKVRSAGDNFVATSESESEEECSVFRQKHSVGWGSVRDMEALPETKGRGITMFVQRRKRMDEIQSQHEEMMGKERSVETLKEAEYTEAQNVYDDKEMYMHADQANYMESNLKQDVEYQENIDYVNHQSTVPKPLVPNRTARPFLGFQNSATMSAMPGAVAPMTKTHEPRFRVPVPIISHPQVWSPTGDIIASRDERISVPAIKTGILPESKRKNIKKQPSKQPQESGLQNKGERRSYIEAEEDCFSLGAEACNFMQPRTIKLKNPPPVAPKPTINPTCPPWMRRSPSGEPYIPPRSPVSQPSDSAVGLHTQQPYLQQQDWAKPQQIANHWAPNQTQAALKTPAEAWAPVNPSAQLHLQPTASTWSQQSPRSPVSMQAPSPTHSPHHPPSPSRNKPDSAPHSVVSCPPQAGMPYVHASKPSQAAPKGRVSGKGVNRAGDGPTMTGKGAELFAKRQSRMEKFVVDDETVQANKARSPSPTSSLPNLWRYSPNVRAPPPLSYNPLLGPSHPASAAKQPPSKSTQNKPKTKEKPKAPKKHLNALDIMKHQPYQLDSSLFKYGAVPEAKGPSPSPSPSPSPKPTKASKFEIIKTLKHKYDPSYYPYNAPELAVQSKPEVPAKSPVPVSSPNVSASRTARSAESLDFEKRLDEKHSVTPAIHHITNKQAPSARPASTSSRTSSQQSSIGDSIAAAFSPASLIARGALQMAPRPKFSAKKPVITGAQWKPVAMLH